MAMRPPPVPPLESQRCDHQLKMVVVGSRGAGKTMLIECGTKNMDPEEYLRTSIRTTLVRADNRDVKVQLWELGGSGEYRSFCNTYRGAVQAFIVFDVTNRESFGQVVVSAVCWLEIGGGVVYE